MIKMDDVRAIIAPCLEKEGCELVRLTISADNVIDIQLDKEEGVDLDFCAYLNNYIQEHLDREIEDYELTVGSVSLTDPFVTPMQYRKNLGHEIEVLQKDGKKLRGMLVEVNDDTFSIDAELMEAVEGKKRKQRVVKTITYAYGEIKEAKYLLKV